MNDPQRYRKVRHNVTAHAACEGCGAGWTGKTAMAQAVHHAAVRGCGPVHTSYSTTISYYPVASTDEPGGDDSDVVDPAT